MKFSLKDFFSKCDQIRRELKKSLMENFIFCAVYLFWKTTVKKKLETNVEPNLSKLCVQWKFLKCCITCKFTKHETLPRAVLSFPIMHQEILRCEHFLSFFNIVYEKVKENVFAPAEF